jgi:hypothetical protein
LFTGINKNDENTAFSLLICAAVYPLLPKRRNQYYNPNRAKLEVFGVAGPGNTSGILAVGGAGISIQQNGQLSVSTNIL